jgi:hypothetical protein
MMKSGLALERLKFRPISNLPTPLANCRKKGENTVRKLKPSRRNPLITFFYAIMVADEVKTSVGVLSVASHGQPETDLENPCDSMLFPFNATAVGLFQTKLLTMTRDWHVLENTTAPDNGTAIGLSKTGINVTADPPMVQADEGIAVQTYQGIQMSEAAYCSYEDEGHGTA